MAESIEHKSIIDSNEINEKIKENWVVCLSKNDVKFILDNKELFDDFVFELAEEFYEDWDEHESRQKKLEWLTKDEISNIIDIES